MKKISLKSVKNALSRDEMRVIAGGCGAFSHNTCGGIPCSSNLGCDSYCPVCANVGAGGNNICVTYRY